MTNRQWLLWQMIDMDNLELAKFLSSSAWFCKHCAYCEGDCNKKMADWLKEEHNDETD